MKVAAYQAPLDVTGCSEMIGLIRDQIDLCESLGVHILCCPELSNAAAIFYRGSVIGIYRKLYPAINRSIYDAGNEMPVFTIGDLTFGIIICNDSDYDEPARVMASKGAAALFVPTNNGLPLKKAKPESVAQDARKTDIDKAIKLGVSVIRADVSGCTESLASCGSSGIIESGGKVLRSATPFSSDLIFADIGTGETKIFATA